MTLPTYNQPSVSNGHAKEQALIRQWWHEVHGARGRLVWEYYLGDGYLDAMWFPDAAERAAEYSGALAETGLRVHGARSDRPIRYNTIP